jgi:major membrane immunogen (membrane-anchored lipoprotein)
MSDNVYHLTYHGGVSMKKILSLTLTLAFVFSIALGSFAFAAKKTYVDGSYKAAYSAFDSHGWKAQIDITIKGDKITVVKFDYINQAGKFKTQDAAYNASMLKVNKTDPALYCPQLSKKLLASQDPSKVDVVTGATDSSNNFKALAAAALGNAKKGAKTIAIVK